MGGNDSDSVTVGICCLLILMVVFYEMTLFLLELAFKLGILIAILYAGYKVFHYLKEEFRHMKDIGMHTNAEKKQNIKMNEQIKREGREFLQREDLIQALSCFNKSLELDPRDPMIWYTKGNILCKLGDHSDASKAYEKATSLCPINKVKALFHYGFTLVKVGRFNDAIPILDKVNIIEPNHSSAWKYRAIAFYELKSDENAIKSINKAISINPADKSIRELQTKWFNEWKKREIHNGDEHLKSRRIEEARKCYEQALFYDEKYSVTWYKMGNVYQILGHYEDACKSYKKAVMYNPRDAYSWYNHSIVLMKLGRPNDAIASIDNAVNIHPYNTDYQHLRNYLRNNEF